MHNAYAIKKSYFNQPVFTAVFAAIVVFLTYGTVYAFRKPFTVATFNGLTFLGVNYKVCLIISQLIGYVASKFYGIKFIAEQNKGIDYSKAHAVGKDDVLMN